MKNSPHLGLALALSGCLDASAERTLPTPDLERHAVLKGNPTAQKIYAIFHGSGDDADTFAKTNDGLFPGDGFRIYFEGRHRLDHECEGPVKTGGALFSMIHGKTMLALRPEQVAISFEMEVI